MAAESTSTKNSTGKSPALWREIGGLVLVALALVILLSILSFDPADLEAAGAPGNLIGPVGVRVGDALLYLFGVGSFFFDALLWYLGFMLIVGRLIEWKWSEIGGQLLFVLSGAMLSHLFFVDYTLFGHMPGGLVGEFTGEVMRGLFGTVGTSIIGVCSLLLSLMLATDMSLGALVRKIMGGVHRFGAWMKHKREVRRLYKERVAEERRKILEQAAKEGKDPAQIAAELSVKPLVEGDYEFDAEKEVEEKLSKKLMNLFKGEIDEDFDEASTTAPDSSSDEADDDDWEMGEPMATDPEIEDEDVADVDDEEEEADEGPEIVIRHVDEDDDEDDATEQNAGDVIDMGAEKKASGPVNADFGPQIVESEAQKKAKAKKDLLAGDDEDGVLFKPKK
ncbi:DNA translocase FtsK 4TM domain-containing protein, partial [Persicimonas caeni]